MSKAPLISIVIPSYNHAPYLEGALDSIVQQRYRPLEIVVIDDGSRDQSPQMIRDYETKALKAGVSFVFRLGPNRGAHNAINTGLKLAKGKWLSILNSDDYFLPNRLSIMMKAAKSKGSSFVFSLVQHVGDQNERLSDTHPMRAWYVKQRERKYPSVGFQLLDQNCAITTGNFLFTRELFEAVGEFRDFKLVHDYDYLLRSLAYTEPFLVAQELLAYRVHGYNTVQESSYLDSHEGPKIAADFILQTTLDPKPRNKKAPWSRHFSNQYSDFWRSSYQGSIRTWLGGQNLMHLYQDL